MAKQIKKQIKQVKVNIQSTSNRFLSAIMMESIIMFLSMIHGIVLTSFLLFIDFRDDQIAVLISIVSLTQLSQIFSTIVYRKFPNKKRVIFILRFVRSISLFCISLVPLVVRPNYYFLVIMTFVFIRNFSLNLIGGGFVEWNDSYIPEGKKGIYYGTRNVLSNGVFIIISFIFGYVLDKFSNNLLIFICIFSIALILNVTQWIVLSKIPFKLPDTNDELPILKTMILPLKDKEYRNFMVFSLLWTLSLSLGRPLLSIYSIKYMKYSYILLATVGSMTAFFKLFSGIYFGKIIDKKSSHFVIILTGIGFGLINFLYIFMSPQLPIIYVIANVINGIFMIGFNVAKFRLNVQLSKGSQMNAYLSMNVFFSGIASFICIYFSSFFIKWLKGVELSVLTYTLNSYQLLFFSSGVLHLITIYYFYKTLNQTKVGPDE